VEINADEEERCSVGVDVPEESAVVDVPTNVGY